MGLQNNTTLAPGGKLPNMLQVVVMVLKQHDDQLKIGLP